MVTNGVSTLKPRNRVDNTFNQFLSPTERKAMTDAYILASLALLGHSVRLLVALLLFSASCTVAYIFHSCFDISLVYCSIIAFFVSFFVLSETSRTPIKYIKEKKKRTCKKRQSSKGHLFTP